jgi:hypothetical protein
MTAMQHRERDVLRWATIVGGLLMFLCIGVAMLDPAATLPAVDAQYVRATLTSVATLGFAALTWGLLHRGPSSAQASRARAWRRRMSGDED